MKNTKVTSKKAITLIIAVALALSIGAVGAFAATNASRIEVERFMVSESGVSIYNNMDENGAIDLTDIELQELYDLMQSRDENGNIIQPADGSELTLESVGEEQVKPTSATAVNVSRIDPKRITVSESGVIIYNNMDENGAIELTDAELQELYDLLQPRDKNGNIIEHICDENCEPLSVEVFSYNPDK